MKQLRCWSAVYSARGKPAEVLTEIKILDGKILIDCNNFDIPEGFAYAPIAQSLAEKLATEVPNAHVVKAFNTDGRKFLNLRRHRSKTMAFPCLWQVTNKQDKL